MNLKAPSLEIWGQRFWAASSFAREGGIISHIPYIEFAGY
jgi:hypothetical protein